MTRARVLTAIVVVGLAVAGVAAQQRGGAGGRGAGPRIPPTGAIEKVKENLYKIGGAGSNTTVFITAEGVVLVDTKLANNGEAILKQVQTVTDKPVTMLINTHVHPDHNGSNDYFKMARPSIQVVAHENTKKWVVANPKANPAWMPDRVFTDKTTLGKGKDRIDLYYFGAGHTNGDAFVVFPSLRAMCIGDLMAWNMAPLIDPATGGSVIALPDTLEKALKGIKNVDVVIEGHGNVNTWQGMRAYTEFNRALLTVAKAALAKRRRRSRRSPSSRRIRSSRSSSRGTAQGSRVRRHAEVARADQHQRRVSGAQGRTGHDEFRSATRRGAAAGTQHRCTFRTGDASARQVI
jgi:glyoxylase-like metal-dependent hydrolase (beta-lactamase superfamily II)